MAVIKFGSIITDSRGSIGGHSFKWTTSGNVLTRKAMPKRTASADQTVIRSRWSDLSKRWWAVLTSSQRSAWRSLAAAYPLPNRWGDDFALTGIAMYLRTNQRLLAVNAGIMDDAPADQTVTSCTAASLSIDAPSTAELTTTPSTVPANHVLIARTSQQLSPGISATPGFLKIYYLAAAAENSPFDISSELLSALGTLHTGRQVFQHVSFLNLDTGAESPALAISTVIT